MVYAGVDFRNARHFDEVRNVGKQREEKKENKTIYDALRSGLGNSSLCLMRSWSLSLSLSPRLICPFEMFFVFVERTKDGARETDFIFLPTRTCYAVHRKQKAERPKTEVEGKLRVRSQTLPTVLGYN